MSEIINNDVKRILLVEDEPLTAMVETMELQKQGYLIIHASSGEQAIDIFNTQNEIFDLVLMDIDLGDGIDGTQAAEIILKNHEVPILFLSSHTEKHIVEKTENITSYGYVVKNSTPTVLFASIKMAFKLFSANLQIRENENRYRELFNNTSNGVAIYKVINNGDDFIFVDYNNAAQKMDGDSRENVIGRSIFDIRPGINEFGLIDVFRRVYITGVSEQLPVKLYKDSRLNKYYNNFVYRLPSGEIVAVYDDVTFEMIAKDIIERKNDLLENIMQTSPIGITVLDNDGQINYCNRMAEQILGLERSKITSKKFNDPTWKIVNMEGNQISDNDLPFALAMKNKTQIFDYRHYIEMTNGKRVALSINSSPLKNNECEIIGVVNAISDISEKIINEERTLCDELTSRTLIDMNKIMNHTQNELFDFMIDASMKSTMSHFSFAGLISDDETHMTIHAWSKNTMNICAVKNNPIHFPINEAGIWGDCIRLRKPVIINDYNSYPSKKGYPEGHVHIKRFLSIPIFDGEHIVAVASVANKITPYNDYDANNLSQLYGKMWEIIRRKKSDTDLVASEKLFKTYIENSPYGIFVTDSHGFFITVNLAAEELTGYTREELIGKNLIEIIHEDERLNAKNYFAYVREKIHLTAETRFITKKNDSRHLLVKAVKLDDNTYLGFTSDITDQKISDEKLRKTNYELQERLKELKCLYNLSGIIENCSSMNDIISQLLTIMPEAFQMPEFTCIKIIFQDNDYTSENFKESCEKLLYSAVITVANEKYGAIEVYSCIKNDNEVETLFLPEELGMVNAIAERLGHVYERLLIEETLQKNLMFQQNLIDAIPMPVFYKDTKGIYTGVNYAFTKFFGKEKKDIIGKSVYDISPKSLADIYFEKDNDLIVNGGIQTYESHVKNARGETHSVVFYKSTFNNPDGKVGGLIGVILV